MHLPILGVLVILGAGVLWLLLSFAFFPLGKFVGRLWKDAKDEMNRDDKETNDEQKE